MMILKDPVTKRVFEMDEATEAGRIRTALKLGWVDVTQNENGIDVMLRRRHEAEESLQLVILEQTQQDDEPVEDKPKRTKRGG